MTTHLPSLQRVLAALRKVPVMAPAGRWLAARIVPERRERSRHWHGDTGAFQPYTQTGDNRYPKLFDQLASELAEVAQPAILSFGCSTGEEVRTLRTRMPQARITGVDVNRLALARARKADDSALSEYCEADRPDPTARYDAVLAMAVFRHGALNIDVPPESSLPVLDFADVDAACTRLDAVVKPGGLFALGHSMFRFEDLAIAGGYELVKARRSKLATEPTYDADNRFIDILQSRVELYRKRR